uniref:Mitochondrial transcription termination factor family protein n=2 Tax=Rhizophora mucronata TaxID=61149 RepID=A0A2P2JAC3_RHIMU
MAKEKGDGGKVALLESTGLGLASAMNVARHLSGEPLPVLIDKVKYMKEVFLSGSDDKEIFVKNARRMLMHLSIAIDDDLQQTLSFFEKVEARRGGLNTLGSPNVAFQYLVESFPLILLLPIESHLKPMVEFLESIEVPKERMAHIFLLFPPIILYDTKVHKRKVLAFEKIGLVGRDLGKMLLKYPWIFSTCIQDNYNEILSLLNMEKVPKVIVDRAVRSWPHILGCATSKMKVMVEQFAELGVKNEKLGQVVAASPQLLLKKPQEFLEVVSFLEDLGFDWEIVGHILGCCPEIFAASIQKTLKKKVEFLRSIGVSEEYLPRAIRKYPELLISNIDRTLIPRMNYLMELGISRKDVAFMVGSFSPLLGYSIDKVLRPKYKFLVNTMKKPVKDVVVYPRYFSYSLERRIKPRFLLVQGSNIDCSLKDMLAKNDVEFAAMFMGAGKMMPPSSPSHH